MNIIPSTSAREKVKAAELNKTIKKRQSKDLGKHRTETIQQVIGQGKGFKMARKNTKHRKASI